ncbi:hypothetical protein [Pseudooceanicola sp. LIPI14-2-Ac024]|uniref:hypothetical protein n=1 Tax=Pseudooceanicola sp. LIPI14-2-Ac024 TaxID=3344875 RepID=UPI0035CFE505
MTDRAGQSAPRPEGSPDAASAGQRTPPEAVPLDAGEVLAVLSGQLIALRDMAMALEATIADTICECSPVSTDTIVSLQRADFLRQSLKDVAAIIDRLGPRVRWRDASGISWQELLAAVDMRESLAGFEADEPEREESAQDIWF